jgi:DNA-binding transcriptional LysR family regulator
VGAPPFQQPARTFETLQLAHEAAALGLGTCLAAPLTIDPFLASGKLVTCGPAAEVGEDYMLYRLCRRAPVDGPTLAVQTWLREEARRSCSPWVEDPIFRPASG